LQAPPMFARMAKRVIVDQDARLVRPALSRKRSTVNAQTFVQGRDATSLIACWKGEVLAALHFEVVQKQYSGGPASVMRVISHPDMCSAAERICRRLELSGFCGFDFVLEDQTGHAHLIEMNSRPTQVGHLTLGPGRDLVAALCAASTGRALQESATITDKNTIALFPQEWVRNPQSPYLETAYHDIPWQEPALVRACVRSSRDWRRFFSFEKKKWIQVPEADRP
jgi:predicted ATP-grasp superfamily ATP-dependent carboligase